MEQLTLDLRIDNEVEFDRSISELIDETLNDNLFCTSKVKSKHEAYGVMAEHLSTITGITKSLKSDVGSLLALLPQQSSGNADTLNAVSAIYNTVVRCAKEAVIMSVFCRKITEDIYEADMSDVTPLEELAENNSFEEAEDYTEEEI
jgi:hypothetical protein